MKITSKIKITKTAADGTTTTLYEGEYTERLLPRGCLCVTLTSNNWDDEEEPLRMVGGSGRTITEDEHTFLLEEGAFTRLHLTHPRADKYGLPLAAAAGYEEFGKIVVSNLGYRPSALEMETQVEDSEDDSPESYVLTFAYPHTEESANLFRD